MDIFLWRPNSNRAEYDDVYRPRYSGSSVLIFNSDPRIKNVKPVVDTNRKQAKKYTKRTNPKIKDPISGKIIVRQTVSSRQRISRNFIH